LSPRLVASSLTAACLALPPLPARADTRYVMVTDRASQRIILFSGADGSLVNEHFIDFLALGPAIGYPAEPVQVDNEIWVSGLFGGVRRYAADGSAYLGTFGASQLSNTFGFEFANGIAYIPCNEGVQAGLVFQFNRSGIFIGGFFVGGSTYDILRRGDELLLSNSGPSGTVILRYSLSGNPLGPFTCPGCPTPSVGGQLVHLPDGGVLMTGHGAGGGLFRYSATGAFVTSYPPAPWGIAALDNGAILCSFRKETGTAGPYDLTTGAYAPLLTGIDSFGAGILVVPSACYANCDGSTTPPILTVSDFGCFLNRFAAGETYANCDGSTQPPALNVLDFNCFLNRFAAGCS